MKQKAKKVFINILLFIILFLILDFFAFYIFYVFHVFNVSPANWYKNEVKLSTVVKSYVKNLSGYAPVIKKNMLYYIINLGYQELNPDNSEIKFPYRPIENPKVLKSVLIFGCSYAYGHSLFQNETFSHQLGKITGYRIYNRAISGCSAQHMLYQAENEDFYNLMPKPKYVIFVFMPDQIFRTYLSCFFDNSIYYKKTKNNNLVIRNFSLNYSQCYLIKDFQYFIKTKFMKINSSNTDFYFQHIYQAIDAMRKHWGNDFKFIFFAYENNFDNKYYEENLKKLENQGVIVVRLKDLSKKDFLSKEYRLGENDFHPNAKAWKEITPLFVKYLNNMGYLK